MCLRAGAVSMEKDALWSLQCHGYISTTDGTRIDKRNEEYGNLVMCYVDDVVIGIPTLEDYIERLDEVFACMKRAGLKCKPSKCTILKDSVKYLGSMVDKLGIKPDPDAAEESFQKIKKELCEAAVLGMPTEKGMYVLDTNASVEAISEILHQEQEWNGKTVLRPIAYKSKVSSDTEMKYGAPKAEMSPL